jgi:hypothetical protein
VPAGARRYLALFAGFGRAFTDFPMTPCAWRFMLGA